MTTEDLELYKLLGFSDEEISKTNKKYYESIELYKFITGGKYEQLDCLGNFSNIFSSCIFKCNANWNLDSWNNYHDYIRKIS